MRPPSAVLNELYHKTTQMPKQENEYGLWQMVKMIGFLQPGGAQMKVMKAIKRKTKSDTDMGKCR
jgi:hypothetical protein